MALTLLSEILISAKRERNPFLWIKVIIGDMHAYVLLQHDPDPDENSDVATYANAIAAELHDLEAMLADQGYTVINASREALNKMLQSGGLTATVFGYGFNFRDAKENIRKQGEIAPIAKNVEDKKPSHSPPQFKQ